MASKYRERLLKSSGISNKKVESEYGMKILKQMGWKDGKGLGKNQSGITECIQLKRREDNIGLGVKAHNADGGWKDSWWDDAYNNSIKKLKVTIKRNSKEDNDDDQSSSSSASSSSSSSSMIPTPMLAKSKKIHKKNKAKKQQQ